MRYAIRVLVGSTALIFIALDQAWATSPATIARCQQYAQKTVHQFELLTTHSAKCHVEPDPQWQPNYDFHYNGCLLFPEFMANAGLMNRDAVLAKCGAFTDPPDSAAAPTSAPTAAPQAVSPPEAVVASSPQARKTGDQCEFRPPPEFKLSKFKGSDMTSAGRPTVTEGILSYKDGATGQPTSYRVQRPKYFQATMECTGAKVSDLSGTWIWLADNGRTAKMFIVSAFSVQAFSLDSSVAKEILTVALPPATR